MTVYFATDHAGFELKNELVVFVRDELGIAVVDYGAHTYDPEDDYPDFIREAALQVSKDPTSARAIILGGSGQGEAMVANRFPGVRATVYYGSVPDIITLSREHNDANVLSIGARFVDRSAILDLVRIWLETPFSDDERHVRRLKKIDVRTL